MLLKQSRQILEDQGILSGFENKGIEDLASIIPDEVPRKMARVIGMYMITSLANALQIKIKLSEDNKVPVNTISFVLAHSGAKKTSSVDTMERALKGGFDVITDMRNLLWKAKKEEAGTDKVPPPAPLFATVSTEAGLVQYMNDFTKEGIGAPSIFVDEIATELKTSPYIVDNIKIISQVFDAGNAKVSMLKGRENQSQEIRGMAMNALFIGAEHGILEDPDTLKMFDEEFVSRLARRTFFCYPVFHIGKHKDDGYNEYRERMDAFRKEASLKTQRLTEEYKERISQIIKKNILEVEITPEAQEVLDAYKIYSEQRALQTNVPAVMLEKKNRDWKVLKLAAAFTIMRVSTDIEVMDVAEAITIAEELDKDLERFVERSQREAHEIVVDTLIETGKPISLHKLIKMKLIKKNEEMYDLVTRANSMAKFKGIIKVVNSEIVGEHFTESDTCNFSYTMVQDFNMLFKQNLEQNQDMSERDCAKMAKHTIGIQCANQVFQNKSAKFEELGKLLVNATAFTPCHLIDGKRKEGNVKAYSTLLAADIDKSDIPFNMLETVLADYRFFAAKTSDVNNNFKYRILLESDIELNFPVDRHKQVLKEISQLLGLELDILPVEQLMYGYSERELLSNMDGGKLPVSKIMQRTEKLPENFNQKVASSVKLESIYDNRRKYFHYAYDLRRGGQQIHTKLYQAARHLHNTGFDYQTAQELFNEFVSTCDATKPGWLDNVLRQMKQWYGEE